MIWQYLQRNDLLPTESCTLSFHIGPHGETNDTSQPELGLDIPLEDVRNPVTDPSMSYEASVFDDYD